MYNFFVLLIAIIKLDKQENMFCFEKKIFNLFTNCGMYYKPMTIVNDNARVVNKLEASLTADARVVIYDRHMFIVQATDFSSLISMFLSIHIYYGKML